MKADPAWINPLSDWSEHPEEAANTLTHGLGFLLSLLGAIVLAMQVLRQGDPWRAAGCLAFSLSLMAVYAMSTLSHVCLAPDLRQLFRRMDQGFIYLLIVATYTPFPLVYLRTPPWLLFLAGLWTVALIGCLSKILLAHRVDGVAVWIYLALGWLPIVSVRPLLGLVPHAALWWMLIGGLCYSIGTVFLMLDRHVRHFHALWHLLVIAGSACHFFVIWLYVAPVPRA